MGGSASAPITWEKDADSISRPGVKCILSGPLSGVEPDAILDLVEKYLRGRPLAADKFEVKRDLEDLKDGGIRETLFMEVTGLANLVVGSISLQLHAVYYFDKPKDTLTLKMFHTDETLTHPLFISTMRILREPAFRIESVTEEFEARMAGPLLRNRVQRQLGVLGFPGDCGVEVPSPTEPGKKSVLSPEMVGAEGWTPAVFWERFSKALEESEGGAVLPDKSVVVEESGLLSGTSYLRYTFLEDSGLVQCQDYMGDDQMESVKLVSYYKLVDSPKRLEAWAMSSTGIRSGNAQKDTVQKLFEGALNFAAQEG